MRLLVCGGAGFIGSAFVRRMLAGREDVEVVCFDKLTYAGNLDNLRPVAEDSRYRFVRGDICDGPLVRETMRGVDAVVHFAAETHVDRSNLGADDFLRTNVTGTFTLLEAARELRVGRFLAVSTD
ncbi:MAG TPA: GDP-mannose 4,6-dehydratase, partial [Coriobacteriia bacterium]